MRMNRILSRDRGCDVWPRFANRQSRPGHSDGVAIERIGKNGTARSIGPMLGRQLAERSGLRGPTVQRLPDHGAEELADTLLPLAGKREELVGPVGGQQKIDLHNFIMPPTARISCNNVVN
jgi:hypothetical protein